MPKLRPIIDLDMLEILQERFYDKVIGIVGGSPIVNWELLSDCDYVVRVNRHLEHQGYHDLADILFFNCSAMINEHHISKATKLVFLDRDAPFCTKARMLCRDLGITCVGYESRRRTLPSPHPCLQWCNELGHMIKTRPLTGISAVHFFRSMPIKKLWLDGMDLYVSEFKTDTPDTKKICEGLLSHDLYAHAFYLAWAQQVDSRVHMSLALEMAIKEWGEKHEEFERVAGVSRCGNSNGRPPFPG